MLGPILLLSGAISVLSTVCPTSCPKNQVLDLYSDTTTLVKGPAQPNLGPATLVDFIHAAWIKFIPGSQAKWISDDENTVERTADDTNRFFFKDVNLECLPSKVIMEISADNWYYIYVNGVATPAISEDTNHGFVRTFDLTSFFNLGLNTVSWRVRNLAGSSNYKNNPTGLIYTLRVTL